MQRRSRKMMRPVLLEVSEFVACWCVVMYKSCATRPDDVHTGMLLLLLLLFSFKLTTTQEIYVTTHI
jgi:hypothetical protein